MSEYVHGVDLTEQERLAGLNRITNAPFLDFLNPPAAGRILEVGSGLGILASQVAEMRPKSTVVGIERSPEQLESANFELSNLDLQLGDAHSLPFAESSFDLV